MHQIAFNEISAAELSVIPSAEQLELFAGFQVSEEFLNGEKEDRRGRKLYPGDKVRIENKNYTITE